MIKCAPETPPQPLDPFGGDPRDPPARSVYPRPPRPQECDSMRVAVAVGIGAMLGMFG